MPFAVSIQHVHYFQSKRTIAFEALLAAPNATNLYKELDNLLKSRNKVAPLWGENLLKSAPQIVQILKKHQVGEIAYELTGIKPWRVAYDLFFHTPHSLPKSLQELAELEGSQIGVLITLKGPESGKVLYLEDPHLETLALPPGGSYLLLVLSNAHLPHERHPLLYS